MSLCLETITQIIVVFYDAIMDEHHTAFIALMRVGVECGGWPVGGPASMGDSSMCFSEHAVFLLDDLSQASNLAALFSDQYSVVAGDGDASRVIATVFKFFKSADENGHGCSFACVSYYSAHNG